MSLDRITNLHLNLLASSQSMGAKRRKGKGKMEGRCDIGRLGEGILDLFIFVGTRRQILLTKRPNCGLLHQSVIDRTDTLTNEFEV